MFLVLLQRRGCPLWMQQMVDQLQCDSCLESSDARNAQEVSLTMPPKLWQAVKVDIFELEDSQRKGFFALYMDAACKLSSCQGLDAAFFAVSVFDFGPWCMFRQ